jgi:hypothetical protein
MENNMSIAGIYEGGKVTIPFVAPMSILSNTPVFGQDSISLKRYVSRRGKAQRWEIVTSLMPTNNDANFLIHSVTNNASKVFDVLMPQVKLQNLTTYTGSIFVGNTIQGGSTSIPVLFTGGTGRLSKGEFIQFSNHDKIYLVTQDRINSGVLSIFPELRVSVDNTVSIKYRNNGTVLLKAYYDFDNVFGIQFTDGILSDPGTVSFIEAV